ncbi:MAG: tripartite tricarboxylate transporter substrate binding protein [Betaproteobacteria bacterium]|nr:tripartite tricarboxylate transporter substrate binding protein [Betaproteobacteria bacterium]PWB63765.1 MAG: Tat pathway signal protein [Betaproteobacteria bacterium]
MITRLARAAGAALALGLSLAAFAQADYPARTVTMIVPFPPGGVADITARPVAEAMGRHLKQTVIVENKAGAGGGVGMQYVARARPDGYTVLLALSSISIIPEADKILGRAPMYQLNQLVPIARFTADPTVLAVRADSPWKSAKEMLEAAQKGPGSIPYGSSGNYGTMHVPMEMLTASAGVKMLHVPFTGAGPAVVALLGGNVDALSTGPSSIMGHLKGGKVRVLASWGESRHPALPDVPTLKELGYDAQFSQWTGLFVPAGTPEPVIAKLREAAKAAASDPTFLAALARVETPPQYLDQPQFRAFWDADAKKLADVVKRIGKVE